MEEVEVRLVERLPAGGGKRPREDDATAGADRLEAEQARKEARAERLRARKDGDVARVARGLEPIGLKPFAARISRAEKLRELDRLRRWQESTTGGSSGPEPSCL